MTCDMFEKHIFICINERDSKDPRGCCKSKGSEQIREWFKEEVNKRGLKGKVRANAAGCLDQCAYGPTVVIYPEGIWYTVKTKADVERIMQEHIEGNQPVKELFLK